MSEAVIVAIIAALGSVIGQWLISRAQAEKRKSDEAARDARMDERLKSVEKKLDEHNGYAEKFTRITADIAELKADIKNLYRKEN